MSFDIRETRLRNDYKRVMELVDRSNLIQVLTTEAEPPERYLIRYTCKGVERLNAYGQPVFARIMKFVCTCMPSTR
jgi:hypothetical protein